MRATIYVAIPVMLLLAIVQTAVLTRFPIFGLTPQISLLVALSWFLLHGVEEGVAWAFIAGMSLDLFSIGPSGSTALAYMVAVLAVAGLLRVLPQSHFFVPPMMAAISSIVYLIVYLLLLQLFGFAPSAETAVNLAPIILLNAGFMLPIYWLVYAIDRRVHPRRVEL
ncbi:MAG: rod shape-determining protein MreD [Chloroflexi bacterium]|nr:rod shape-determining protein MreD [Chloroflexota bacterium]